MFMKAEMLPEKSPPTSSGTAHETPTVHSSAKNAIEEKMTEVGTSAVRAAGTVAAEQTRKPAIATHRRARLMLLVRFNTRSEHQPPSKSPAVPASSGRLA